MSLARTLNFPLRALLGERIVVSRFGRHTGSSASIGFMSDATRADSVLALRRANFETARRPDLKLMTTTHKRAQEWDRPQARGLGNNAADRELRSWAHLTLKRRPGEIGLPDILRSLGWVCWPTGAVASGSEMRKRCYLNGVSSGVTSLQLGF